MCKPARVLLTGYGGAPGMGQSRVVARGWTQYLCLEDAEGLEGI